MYQYTVGGVVFAGGVVCCAKYGYISLRGRGLLRLILLIVGLALFAGIQGYLQYAPMHTALPGHAGARPVPTVSAAAIDYVIMAAYFVGILAVGTWFGRRQRTLNDFFFGGQRFSWWLVSLSLMATLVGSYSFVKYSRVAFEYGLSSSQSYLNDWFWTPLLLFGWLPILYFSRVGSVPEYFERRFGTDVRVAATIMLLLYLIGYVGVNLFTMGKALHILLGWDVFYAAIVVAGISMIYVTAGGQTSVIMTDLLQGLMLLVVGGFIIIMGIAELGGFTEFWTHLPRTARQAFPELNANPDFSGVGIFWQDAMANSAMFYFINQGILMRFMAARSIYDVRKAAVTMILVLMPLAAIVVAGGGWIARAMVHSGTLPDTVEADKAFFVAARVLSRPGMFGLIMAALTAALMSTVDTLLTAVAAIGVNDVYRPFIRPQASDRELLGVARIMTVGVAAIGIALVPVFMSFDSIYAAHGAFTAAVTPPLVVTLLMSLLWKRFTRAAALATLIGGGLAIILSFFLPQIIAPFDHGVPRVEDAPAFKQYKFMRACFGLCVSAVIAVVVSLLSRKQDPRQRGLMLGEADHALQGYAGQTASEQPRTRQSVARVRMSAEEIPNINLRPGAVISTSLSEALDARVGCTLYVSDQRRFLGGLRSAHVGVARIEQDKTEWISLPSETYEAVIAPQRTSHPVRVENMY